MALPHPSVLAIIVLMMVGFYTLISRDNLVKKLIGLNIFQTSVIMMYVSFGKVTGGTAPILFSHYDEGGGYGEEGDHGAEGAEAAGGAADRAGELAADLGDAAVSGAGQLGDPMSAAAQAAYEATRETVQAAGFEAYSNPLPHVLMLTAIVVGVATLSLGLSLVVRIHEAYGTIEENEINRMDLES